MATDLYLQLQKNLVRGFNIQTMNFRSWTRNGKESGDIVITYLNGERVTVPQDPIYTPEERSVILDKILEIQEKGCYPRDGKTCELGIMSLN